MPPIFKEHNKMGVVVATAMSVTVVVGAGLLVLPGLTFAYAGHLGYLPWLVVAALMIPLLIIFSYFGKTFPSAGGVVGYVRSSLGHPIGAACEMIVLGTFTLGIPAIALIGAGYMHQTLPSVPPQTLALGMVTVALLAGLLGLRLSGAVQTTIAVIIVIGLLAIGIGFLSGAARPGPAPVPIQGESRLGFAMAIPVVLFAFTGWEMTAFLAEDMRDPKRDLPRSIWASFVIVVILYLFLAWIVSTYAQQNDGWIKAPILEMAKSWLGLSASKVVGGIVTLLVLANVVAAFMSASRAIYSAGRDGRLPRSIGKVSTTGNPLVAMILTYAIFCGVILTTSIEGIHVGALLQLAGQNFFVLYLFSALGYVAMHRTDNRRWIGYIAAAFVVMAMTLFSLPGLIYCVVLGAVGYCLTLDKTTAST